MITNILFNKIKKTEEREAFVKEQLEHVLEKFEHRHGITQTVRVGLENPATHKGKTLVRCEVQVRGKSFPNVIIKKTGENFHQAIAITADRLGQLLSRIHDKNIFKRRKKSRQALELMRTAATRAA